MPLDFKKQENVLPRTQQTEVLPIHERFECIGECVLVRRIEAADEVTDGGIIKPEISRQKSNRGEIVALGEGRLIEGHWMPLNLHIGDIVHFTKHAVGMEVEIDKQLYLKLHWKQLHLLEKQLVQ